MSDFLEALAAIYAIVAAILCFAVGLITAFDAEHETNVMIFSFYVEQQMWRCLKDELNTAGLVIAEIVVIFFCLPANLLLLLTKLAILLCATIWNVYKKLFARKTMTGND